MMKDAELIQWQSHALRFEQQINQTVMAYSLPSDNS